MLMTFAADRLQSIGESSMNDLEIIYNIQELYEHKVVLFGAGDIGKRIQTKVR